MQIEECPTPAVPSAEVFCDVCRNPCWLGYDLFPQLQNRDYTIKCMSCVVPQLITTEDPEFVTAAGSMSPEMAAALARWTIENFGGGS